VSHPIAIGFEYWGNTDSTDDTDLKIFIRDIRVLFFSK
jgi:hypothetical protein